MTVNRTCDGLRRRDLLRAGALGVGGLSLSGYLRMADAAQVNQAAAAQAAIFVELPGGPSHIDTFDLKPEAPEEIRGTFQPIATNVPGIQISEHLPKLAGCADKFAILRGVSHTLAAHDLGQEYINTGSRPLASLEYPGYGSVLSRERPSEADIPSHVAIPRASQGAGFLGIRYAPLSTNSAPRFGQPYRVRGLSLTGDLTVEQVSRRQSLLEQLDGRMAGLRRNSQLIEGLDQFGQQAHSMITSPRARKAFDISEEPSSFASQFGETPFGQSCLLAIRLVESGVRFVTVQLGGWDTHQDNFTRLKTQLLPTLDAGLAGLFTGLEQRGLLSSTAVMVSGEFGRTPKINQRSAEGGRDHYPRCMCMLMAGGGVRGGQVVGASDATASGPAHEAITPDDVAASLYHNLGIDPATEYHTETGRPITLVRDGRVIEGLFG
ncbi:DUF1501 domain-containing protein [Candidatus Laterigemmans baculatus]|uniref:DUF1501 domain-containing protein n=1 Tax=Candidatus Laterigemmans baculatus TaxID=2770505 RepID=UPI0013DB489B|nr:DUF1501 domain-containing protein [Candidatus Laterigemmans baculatus]